MKSMRWWPWAIVPVLILINLPLGHYLWTNQRLDTDGLTTSAEVVSVKAVPEHGENQKFYVTWRFADDVEAGVDEFTSEVTAEGYRTAERTDTLEVEYLPGNVDANRPVARPTGSMIAVIITAAGNVTVLAMMALMLWSRRNAQLEVLALGDVVRCKPPEELTELEHDEVIVRGEVEEIADDRIVLRCRGKRVTVILGEFSNPIGYQQFAEVHGRRVPR
ncbi:hypothetical protein ACLM5J_08005 [Nocardioides sp. Bht2]|uniref:hypothetical protein n=1 Tax=Nocardioides sp. Bht2 TaxID=3392297 RepID=UPI0039B4A3F6